MDPILIQDNSDSIKTESEYIVHTSPSVLVIVSSGNDLYEQLVVVEEVTTSKSLPESTHLEDIIVAAAEQECVEQRKSTKTGSTYECKICHKTFNNRQNISRHMIRIHHIRRGREVASKTISCKENGCTRAFASLKDLKSHLMQSHDFNFREDVTEFTTWDDFMVWKKKFESTHNVSFVQHSGSKRWCSKNVVYYYCHKSGDYESQSKGQRKRNSCKVGFSCTATMKVTIDKGTEKVVVYSCNDHYGHEV